ncbi:PH domain-containing protein [Candidatus Margulisiibacteriota bacterium]
MGYIDNNLMNDEQIYYRAKLHWAIFITPIIFFLFGIMLFGNNQNSNSAMNFFILISIILFVRALLNYTSSEFCITNKRIIMKVGFIRRKTIEIVLNKVEGIQANQGIFGRILNYGSIIISGSGGLKSPFHKILAPIKFRNAAQEQISKV